MPYIYRTKNRKGDLEDYSREYSTMSEALTWYEENGRDLEKQFNRELILILLK